MSIADFFQIGKLYPSHTRPLPPEEWPAEWKTPTFKTYPRLPKIRLPLPADLGKATLGEALLGRRSKRHFSPESLSLQELSALLYYSAGIIQDGKNNNAGVPRRFFPSGGGLYPIEIYPLVIRGDNDIPAGLYHYAVKTHELEILRQDITPAVVEQISIYDDWARQASVIFLITGVAWRSEAKYGDAVLRLLLIEAGHLVQNFYLVATALNVAGCALAGIYHDRVSDLLNLWQDEEIALYAFLAGKEKNV